jgi:hypothetical protein
MYNHPASSVIATMAVAMTNIRFVSMWRRVHVAYRKSAISIQLSMHGSGSASARPGGKLNRDRYFALSCFSTF